MKAQNLNDLLRSCFDLKLGPNTSHARDLITGTTKNKKPKTNQTKKSLGRQGLGNPRGKVEKSANIRGTNFPKMHFIKKKRTVKPTSFLSFQIHAFSKAPTSRFSDCEF